MGTKHALVTGASRGLGHELAVHLTKAGWSVTGFARRPPDELGSLVPFDYFQADLSTPEVLPVILGRVGGPLDLVVHCAVHHEASMASGLTASEMAFRVNALTPYHLSEALLKRQPAERLLSVIMINSESIFHADRHSAVYAASKAALRPLAAGLAESCRSRNASVATVLLGPLADEKKLADLRRVAHQRGVTEDEITKVFLRRSNPDLVIESLIDYEACVRTVEYVNSLGRVANGMVCRLDGGSAGSLI